MYIVNDIISRWNVQYCITLIRHFGSVNSCHCRCARLIWTRRYRHYIFGPPTKRIITSIFEPRVNLAKRIICDRNGKCHPPMIECTRVGTFSGRASRILNSYFRFGAERARIIGFFFPTKYFDFSANTLFRITNRYRKCRATPRLGTEWKLNTHGRMVLWTWSFSIYRDPPPPHNRWRRTKENPCKKTENNV